MNALFWIDTICVPRADLDHEYREMTLSRMLSTYQDSHMVLVFDAELYHTRLTSTLEAVVIMLLQVDPTTLDSSRGNFRSQKAACPF